MAESFAEIFAAGGKSNSLGRTDEVITLVLNDKNRMNELYGCVFDDDAWIRMRAIDALEKICRQRPDWLLPYIDKFQAELTLSNQPSIQWHLAQIYRQVNLSPRQKILAINWLKNVLSNVQVDWIVAANAMQTLVQFTKDGSVAQNDAINLIKLQQKHKSNAVVKKANKLLLELIP